MAKPTRELKNNACVLQKEVYAQLTIAAHQLSVLSAAEDPYKESEKVLVLWFSPEAGLCVPVQLPVNKPGHSSNQKLCLKGLLNKKAG